MKRNLEFAATGMLIPLVLWGIMKCRAYGVIGGAPGDRAYEWAFQFLIMLAPLLYHTVALLQGYSLAVACAVAFGLDAATMRPWGRCRHGSGATPGRSTFFWG